ncbi:MAG: NUDIX hydrolase [Chloroflexi bacterium]|nr:NUDIX hydrolase [Chloroflexota bacterium]
MRPRVCAAIIREKKILMVKHEHKGQRYWTLPGGGVEAGERLEQAVIREVKEETHLLISDPKLLFEEPYSNGINYCFLATIGEEAEAKLGYDPEENEIPPQKRILQDVAWHSLKSMRFDSQISKVIELTS